MLAGQNPYLPSPAPPTPSTPVGSVERRHKREKREKSGKKGGSGGKRGKKKRRKNRGWLDFWSKLLAFYVIYMLAYGCKHESQDYFGMCERGNALVSYVGPYWHALADPCAEVLEPYSNRAQGFYASYGKPVTNRVSGGYDRYGRRVVHGFGGILHKIWSGLYSKLIQKHVDSVHGMYEARLGPSVREATKSAREMYDLEIHPLMKKIGQFREIVLRYLHRGYVAYLHKHLARLGMGIKGVVDTRVLPRLRSSRSSVEEKKKVVVDETPPNVDEIFSEVLETTSTELQVPTQSVDDRQVIEALLQSWEEKLHRQGISAKEAYSNALAQEYEAWSKREQAVIDEKLVELNDFAEAQITQVENHIKSEASKGGNAYEEKELVQVIKSKGKGIRDACVQLRNHAKQLSSSWLEKQMEASSKAVSAVESVRDEALATLVQQFASLSVQEEDWQRYGKLRDLSFSLIKDLDPTATSDNSKSSEMLGRDMEGRINNIARDAADRLKALKSIGHNKIKRGDDSNNFGDQYIPLQAKDKVTSVQIENVSSLSSVQISLPSVQIENVVSLSSAVAQSLSTTLPSQVPSPSIVQGGEAVSSVVEEIALEEEVAETSSQAHGFEQDLVGNATEGLTGTQVNLSQEASGIQHSVSSMVDIAESLFNSYTSVIHEERESRATSISHAMEDPPELAESVKTAFESLSSSILVQETNVEPTPASSEPIAEETINADFQPEDFVKPQDQLEYIVPNVTLSNNTTLEVNASLPKINSINSTEQVVPTSTELPTSSELEAKTTSSELEAKTTTSPTVEQDQDFDELVFSELDFSDESESVEESVSYEPPVPEQSASVEPPEPEQSSSPEPPEPVETVSIQESVIEAYNSTWAARSTLNDSTQVASTDQTSSSSEQPIPVEPQTTILLSTTSELPLESSIPMQAPSSDTLNVESVQAPPISTSSPQTAAEITPETKEHRIGEQVLEQMEKATELLKEKLTTIRDEL